MFPNRMYVDKNLENKRSFEYRMNIHHMKMQMISESKDTKVHAVPHLEETKEITKALKRR